MSDIPKFPISLPGGDMIPYLSARHRTEVVDTVFEMNGGTEKLYDWTRKSDANYETFIVKLWGKGMAKAVSHAHTLSDDSLEARLKKLDAAERATTINGTANEVHDMSVIDVPDEED